MKGGNIASSFDLQSCWLTLTWPSLHSKGFAGTHFSHRQPGPRKDCTTPRDCTCENVCTWVRSHIKRNRPMNEAFAPSYDIQRWWPLTLAAYNGLPQRTHRPTPMDRLAMTKDIMHVLQSNLFKKYICEGSKKPFFYKYLWNRSNLDPPKPTSVLACCVRNTLWFWSKWGALHITSPHFHPKHYRNKVLKSD